jgi:hypothetical protein
MFVPVQIVLKMEILKGFLLKKIKFTVKYMLNEKNKFILAT